MNRVRTTVLLVLVLIPALLWGVQARAQDTDAPVNQAAVVNTGSTDKIAILKDEPFQVYVAGITVNTKGQFGDLWPYAIDAKLGPTRLTPCNDVDVPCQPIHSRIDAATASQGQVFVLDFDHPITPAQGS